MGKSKVRLQGPLLGSMLGVACGIVMCLSGLAVLTQLIMTQKAGERSVAFAVPVLLAVSSFVGCQITVHSVYDDKIIGTAITAGALILAMLIGGFTTEGTFCSVATNLGVVAIGGVPSCILCLKKPVKAAHRKRRYR